MTGIQGLSVRRDDINKKYDATIGDEEVGMVIFGTAGTRIILTHAAVRTDVQHRGIGTALLSHVLRDIRDRGETATVICPVVRDFIDLHPEFADVVDTHDPGIRSRAQRSLASV